MNKHDIIKYLNDHNTGKYAGRKDIRINDVFISGVNADKHFRVTVFGRDLLSKHFDVYKLNLSCKQGKVSSKQVLQLDRYMYSPYYLHSGGTLYLFEQSIASEFILLDSDFDAWVDLKSFND